MNRNKKTFTPNMRVAALYLLMGVLLLLAVTLFSGRESMRATEEYFDRTINFVKVQSTSYEKYNDTVTAKALRRMSVSVRQLAENDALDIYDPEALRKETESLWLTGIAVLDENGESLCEYTDGNIDYAQFAESLREQAALNVLQNPQKTYLKRILLQDGTAVDVATRRAAAGDAVLLAYRVTPPEFVEGTALSIQSVLDGYPKNISGTIFIVQDNKVIAANDPSLIGLYTTNSPLVQGIRKAGAPDILTHTRDWANSGCYFGMYSNGQNFDLYLYIDEKSVFRNFSSALLTALIFYLICVAVLQTLRRRSMKLAEQQKREQEQKYHAQLEEQNRKLELAVRHEAAANRAKREFLFNMSHDIRTPMNAIIGFTSLAATHVENKEQVLDYLKKISTSSQHLLSLINDVLDMSRIESGKVKIEEKAVHLPDLVHDIRSIIQPNISSKRLSLFIDTMDVVDEDIITDPLRLNQVLLNILSNAIKFTPTGGMVSIRIAQKPGAPKGCGNYEFRIKDNGIGINKEFQKHIFEEFTREESSTVSGIQGTGLGLSITKNIVDLMGGTIAIESEPGKGSEFIVDLCFALSGRKVEPKQIPQLEGLRGEIDAQSSTKLTVDCGGLEQCLVWGDREMAEQICFHLLSNALRAAAPGGNIQVCLRQTGQDIRLTIEDDGCGLPEAGEDAWLENRRCFLGGAKLGLLLCRECCRRMGWGLRVERAPEKGTQAVVTIPLCTDRITEPTVELHTGGDTAQAQQHQYQLRNMLVRELRTMPERGDPDEL